MARPPALRVRRPQLVFIVTSFVALTIALTARQSLVTALVGGTIYSSPSAAAITDGVLLLQGSKVLAVGSRGRVTIPPNAHVIKTDGMYLVAGFQNSHVHFTPPGWTAEMGAPAAQVSQHLTAMLTRWGFTTVVDTGSDPASTSQLRKTIESQAASGPRILTAGIPIYPPEGIPYYLSDLPPALLQRLHQPATPTDASKIVADAERETDIVKLFAGSWVTRQQVLPMPQDIAAAAVAEAHRAGKLVFAHPSNIAGLNVALDAGVDVLAHALDNTTGLTAEHFRQMKRQNMAMVPTLALFKGDAEVISEVRSYFEAGGQMLFGTDVGYLPDPPPTREYELMARAGLGWRDILAALTTNPADRFRESRQRGVIAAGMDGDVVVLRRDPASDVRAFADVVYTIRAGRVIYRHPD